MRAMMWSVSDTATITDAAMQRWPAQPDIDATTLRRRHLAVGVGHDDQVVLRAAEREAALEVRRRAAVDDLRDLRRADEADARRCRDGRRSLRPPRARRARPGARPPAAPPRASSSAMRRALSGTSSDGLRIMQLPSAIAFGIVQFGTMFGKLNGVIDATTPTGIALDAALDAAAHLEHFARRDLRQRAGELGELGRLEHLGARLAGDLAVLLGDERGELVDVLLEERLVAVEDLDALLDRRRGPGREGSARRLRPRRRLRAPRTAARGRSPRRCSGRRRRVAGTSGATNAPPT